DSEDRTIVDWVRTLNVYPEPDAYPVGLPVELPASTPRPAPDTWLEIEGTMQTTTLDGKRQLAIGSATLTEIPEPRTPYEY
ncbi:MAG TPA: TIGR03943 family protein, partial [Nodosilinea sp.]|nr:TIGR03943 family protein [Nodosilinea sp.]